MSSSSSTSSSSSSRASDEDDDVIHKKSHILNIVDSFSKLFDEYLDIHRDIDLAGVKDKGNNNNYDNNFDNNKNDNNNYDNNDNNAITKNNNTTSAQYVKFSDDEYSNNRKLSFALGSFVKMNNHMNKKRAGAVSVNIVNRMQILDIQ